MQTHTMQTHITQEVTLMLGKLIKYDLKSMTKTIVPLWITVIALTLILTITNWGTNLEAFAENNTVMVVLTILLFSVSVAILVMNILFIVQRFWNGLLKEEGYLMFTLPVSTRKLILAKGLSALLITLGSIFVAILCVIIIALSYAHSYDGTTLIAMLKIALQNTFLNITGSDIVETILYLIFVPVFFLTEIYQAYTAMAIGQLSNKNRFMLSIVAYIGITIIFSMIASVFDFIRISNSTLETVFFLATSIVKLLIFHGITETILTRKLNLE